MRLVTIALALILTGCASSVETKRGKVYIKSDTLPTVTNDKNYGSDRKQVTYILVRRGIFYYYVIRF